MDKHTPGPWLRDKYGNLVGATDDRVAFRSVTTVCSGSDDRISEAEANTTLIAAAPELLEALELVQDCLVKCLTGGEVSAKLAGKAITQAAQLIEKARGA